MQSAKLWNYGHMLCLATADSFPMSLILISRNAHSITMSVRYHFCKKSECMEVWKDEITRILGLHVQVNI
jgi:hypothetical protein